jgi:hypothetical protein
MPLAYTPIEAFLLFATDLEEGEWSNFKAEPFLAPDAPSSLTASHSAHWKIKLERARRGLSAIKISGKTRAPITIDRDS